MANPYFNPSSMFQNDWKPSGGLGGYLAGLQNSYTEEYAKRGLQASDQSLEMEKFKMEQLRQEAPSKASANELKMLEDQAKADTYRDGTAQQSMRDKMASEAEVGRGNAAKAISQQDELKGKFMVEFSESLKGTDRKKLDMSFWDHWREKAKRAGVKMPDVMSDEQIERTHKNAQGYINSAEQQRARQLAADHDAAQAAKSLADRNATRTSVETEGGLNRENAREVARIGATSRENINTNTQDQLNERARLKAVADRERMATRQSVENQLVSELRALPANASEADIDRIINRRMDKLIEVSLDSGELANLTTVGRNRKKEEILELYRPEAGKGEPTGAKSAPTGGLPKVTDKASYDALKKGDKYEDADGKIGTKGGK